MINPRFLLTFGVILMLLGILFPFLMVIKIMHASFFLSFLSSAISTIGLTFGMIGFTGLSKSR